MKTRLSHAPALLFLWSYVRRRRLMALGVICISLVSTGLMLMQPFFYRAALNAITGNAAGNREALTFAIIQIAYGVGVAAVALVCEQTAAMMLGRVELHVMRAAHIDVFARVQRLSTNFHVNEFSGATSRKIGRGVESLENMLDRIGFNVLPTVAMITGFLVILSFYAPLIGIVMLVGSVLTVLISLYLNGILGRYYTWADQQDTKVTANLVDVITANPLVKSFAGELREDTRHDGIIAEWQRRWIKAWTMQTFINLAQFFLLLVIEFSVLSLAIYLWYTGSFTPGDFLVIMLYVVQLWGRLWDVGRNIRDYMKSVAHCQEMLELVHRPFSVFDAAKAVRLDASDGSITFDDVGFRYQGQNHDVFAHFSLNIKPGERIALVGHSGGGKSTFVKLLTRLYDVSAGSICIDGQDIRTVTQDSLRTAIALVPQDPILFHRSLRENISYGKPDATVEEIVHAAQLAHAHEFIGVLRDGYDTLVGERGIKLSGGERQRVAIARAILANRPILILDEATSSLDSLSESYIQDALEHLMQDRTSIVIAHRLSTIKLADRILVIERGSIVEQGSHAQLLRKNKGVYRQLYEMQAGGFIGE